MRPVVNAKDHRKNLLNSQKAKVKPTLSRSDVISGAYS
jgi:hypothetical protein